MLAVFVVMASALFASPAAAQVCTIACNLTGAINDYWPGTANVATGATSITIGARRAGAGTAGNTLAVGDWVIVMQVQDATINTANTTAYGANGTTGAGYLAANRTGLYEYARVTSAVGAGGGTLSLASALVNNYNVTAVAGAQTTPRFQVIRIPHCATANLSGTLIGAPWNGTTGGVIALRGETVNMGGAIINANGLGFRGGATDAHNAPFSSDNYRSTDVRDQYKGEGIVGTPDFIYDTATATEIATGLTFPNGYRARGAPGNAGGGGEGDSGGGGGANAGAGGRGGVWSNTAGSGAGGRGGAVFAERTFSRVALGGGGAGGSAGPDAGFGTGAAEETTPPYGTGARAFARGGAGGGVVILGAVTRNGSLTINANGVAAPFTAGTVDAIQVGGGGGAGGSVVLYGTGGTIAANVAGGDGANSQRAVHQAHGGGGGGGAVFAFNALTGVTSVLTAGRAGCTVAGSNDTVAGSCAATDANSSTAGAVGAAATFATAAAPGTPDCVPANITVTKTNVVSTVTAGQTMSYTVTVANGGSRAANNSVLQDTPSAGLSCTAVTCSGSTPAGNCPAAASVTIANLLGPGISLTSLPASSTLTFAVTCGVTANGQ